jgi:hypothetical protein
MRWTWKFSNRRIKSFSETEFFLSRHVQMSCADPDRFAEDIGAICGEPLGAACAEAVLLATTQLGDACLGISVFTPTGPPIGAYVCYGEGQDAVSHICSTNGYERRAPDKPAGPAPDKPAGPAPDKPAGPGASGGTALRPFDVALRKAGVYTTLGLGAGVGAIEYAKARQYKQKKAPATRQPRESGGLHARE